MAHFFKTTKKLWCQKCRNYGNTKVVTWSMKAQGNSTVIQIMDSSMKRENKSKRQSHFPRSLPGWRRPTQLLQSWRTMRSSKARILMSRFKITCIIPKGSTTWIQRYLRHHHKSKLNFLLGGLSTPQIRCKMTTSTRAAVSIRRRLIFNASQDNSRGSQPQGGTSESSLNR